MQQVIKEYFQNIKLGQTLQTYKNMSIISILADDCATADYLLLSEALSEHFVTIKETCEQGQVPQLKVTNHSPKMILMLDGLELGLDQGLKLKQNRILNQTVLVKGKHTGLFIPVVCCEQNRWCEASSGQSALGSSRIAYRKLRSTKNISENSAKQQAVWASINERISRRSAISLTSAMSSLYENPLDKIEIDAYTQNFTALDKQVGAIFFINGKLSGVECFSKSETFYKTASMFFESYGLDALDKNNDKVVGSTCLETQAKAFIEQLLQSDSSASHSIDLGTDIRFQTNAVIGSALTLFEPPDEQLIYLSAFPMQAKSNRHTKMLKSSLRRRRMH